MKFDSFTFTNLFVLLDTITGEFSATLIAFLEDLVSGSLL